jgi:hypothetical protein
MKLIIFVWVLLMRMGMILSEEMFIFQIEGETLGNYLDEYEGMGRCYIHLGKEIFNLKKFQLNQ